MAVSIEFPNLTEADVVRFADDISFMLSAGDTIALEGDLGAGKTTFARALIRSLANDQSIEVPSPTFTLVQTYETPRFNVGHFDLYRLADSGELDELGFDAIVAQGVAIVEWPSRGGNRLPEARFTLAFTETTDEATRTLTLSAPDSLAPRAQRMAEIRTFLTTSGWGGGETRMTFLQGDASPRRYARVARGEERAVLMDSPRQADGPPIRDGQPYSRIAHLAEDVSAFAAVGEALIARGFSAPQTFATDFDRGFLLIEDLGDRVFGQEVKRGTPQEPMWRQGVEKLIVLRAFPPEAHLPLPGGASYTLPICEAQTLGVEIELLLDWYWPAITGGSASASQRAAFLALWQPVFARVLDGAGGWLLRDYHSPNLLVLEDRAPPRDTGIIDYQDAMIGPWAYDLVSLLQDARLDVAADIEQRLLDLYISETQRRDSTFDEARFRFAYAALGAQRNSKILGIFTRLAVRDGKRQYLAHIPRIWRYLARDLAHPELRSLKDWYDEHLPESVRGRALAI